jgi:prevent-host-death family protein
MVIVRNISRAKAKLSAPIESARKGDEVVIAKAGKPVAKIVPYHGSIRPRAPGSMAGEIKIAPDFDVLSDDVAQAFGMTESRE